MDSQACQLNRAHRKEPPSFKMGLPVIGPIVQFLKDPMELMRPAYI